MSEPILSASCLAYLYADYFVETLTQVQQLTGEAAVETPLSGSLVHLAKLERELLAIGVWSLWDRGLLDIEDKVSGLPLAARATSWPYRSHENDYRILLCSKGGSCRVDGLEGLLLSFLVSGPADLWHLICDRWLNCEPLAVNGILVLAQQEALDAGFVMVASDGSLPRSLRWMKGHTKLRGMHEKLRDLEPVVAELASQVARSRSQRGQAWELLLRDCGKVLYEARRHSGVWHVGQHPWGPTGL